MRSLCLALAIVVPLAVVGAADAPTPYAALCAAMADAGAKRLVADSGVVAKASGVPDFAFETPSWVLACLTAGVHTEEASKALQAVAGAVDTTGPLTKGLLPWSKGDAPSLAATEVAACPLAACLIFRRDAMTGPARDALAAALKSMAAALGRAKPESADTRRLCLAAACVALGRACDDPSLVSHGLALADAWLEGVQALGLAEGRGPTAEAYRLASLAWIKLLAPRLPPSWDVSWRLLWADLLQRLQSGGGLLAGVQQFAWRPDYLDGLGPIRWLFPLAAGRPVPAADPAVGYFCLPFAEPLVTTPPVTIPVPASSTYTWSIAPLVQETVWTAAECSLATMTGPLDASSVPVMMTLPARASRPTAYLYASVPCTVFSLQRDDTAVVNFEFDNIGWGKRVQAWTDVVLGPSATIKQVSVLGRPWDGRTMGFDETWPICVETDGAYIAVVPLWCGPANASTLTERVKPGILQWLPDQATGELVLRIFARQGDYRLPRPENDDVVGLVVTVKPASSMSFDDFAKSLRRVRYTKAIEERSWRVPGKDEGHPVLDKYKPKPKSAYRVEHATDYTLTCVLEGKKWVMTMDLTTDQMRARSIADQALPAPTLQFDTPLLKLAPGWRKLDLPADLVAALTPPR